VRERARYLTWDGLDAGVLDMATCATSASTSDSNADCMLTMGYTIRLDRDYSKQEVVAVCRELGEMFGPGNEFRPYAGKGLVEWWRRYGETGEGGKALKLVMHKRWRVESIAWPREVPENVMELWKDDDSLCVRKGWYRTKLLTYGRVDR